MNKIAIVTATRAEYGLLSPIIKRIRQYESDDLRVALIVTGTHLSSEYGMTVEEIDDRIDYRIPIPVDSSDDRDISKNQAEALVRFTELFVSCRFDSIIILGDRYEALAIAIAAGNTRTPVIHISGGDTTEGALDEWMRHCITKIAYLHFPTNEVSYQRILQLGESPDRVFNYGSTSIDNIMKLPYMSKKEALDGIGVAMCDYALCTYQPETMDSSETVDQLKEILEAIRDFPEIIFIFTKANADRGGNSINHILEQEQCKRSNMYLFDSLGVKRYIGLMRHCEFVLGNSSSGIIEAPACKVPTVNIGDRQRGRLRADSVIDCRNNASEICEAIRRAMTSEHKEICQRVVSPYGAGNAAEKIAAQCVKIVRDGHIDLKKKFYECGGNL